jgi:hypothetical protein
MLKRNNEMEIQVDFESVSQLLCNSASAKSQQVAQVSPPANSRFKFPPSDQIPPRDYFLSSTFKQLIIAREQQNAWKNSLSPKFPLTSFPSQRIFRLFQRGKFFSAGFSNPRNIENSLTFPPQANETQ